jgi:hypothetical protein
MVIVLVLIGILAVFAMPDLSVAAIRGQIKESGPLIDVAKQGVVRGYGALGKFPADNVEAGIPDVPDPTDPRELEGDPLLREPLPGEQPNQSPYLILHAGIEAKVRARIDDTDGDALDHPVSLRP